MLCLKNTGLSVEIRISPTKLPRVIKFDNCCLTNTGLTVEIRISRI